MSIGCWQRQKGPPAWFARSPDHCVKAAICLTRCPECTPGLGLSGKGGGELRQVFQRLRGKKAQSTFDWEVCVYLQMLALPAPTAEAAAKLLECGPDGDKVYARGKFWKQFNWSWHEKATNLCLLELLQACAAAAVRASKRGCFTLLLLLTGWVPLHSQPTLECRKASPSTRWTQRNRLGASRC